MLRFAGSTRSGFDIPPSPHSSASRIAPRSYSPGDAAMRGRPFEGYYLFPTYCGGELRRTPSMRSSQGHPSKRLNKGERKDQQNFGKCFSARSKGNIRDIVLFGKEDKDVLVQPHNRCIFVLLP